MFSTSQNTTPCAGNFRENLPGSQSGISFSFIAAPLEKLFSLAGLNYNDLPGHEASRWKIKAVFEAILTKKVNELSFTSENLVKLTWEIDGFSEPYLYERILEREADFLIHEDGKGIFSGAMFYSRTIARLINNYDELNCKLLGAALMLLIIHRYIVEGIVKNPEYYFWANLIPENREKFTIFNI